MKEHVAEADESQPKKKKTLLERYEIPIEHLDFKYVNTCKDSREIERILKVLRSGEEGFYPDLEKCVVTRLELLNPKSRALRVETPILRSELMGTQELDELKKSFLDWVDHIEEENRFDTLSSITCEVPGLIFQNVGSSEVPIRTLAEEMIEKKKPSAKKINEKEKITEEPGFIRPSNPDRIKSWEYDKWDKFDADTELTKLDIETLQSAEKDQELDVQKLKREQELVAKYMKNIDIEEKKQHIKAQLNNPKINSTVNENKNQVPALEDDDQIIMVPQVKPSPPTSQSKLDLPCSSSSIANPTRNFLVRELQATSNNKSKASPNNYGNPSGKSFIEEISETEEKKPKHTDSTTKGTKNTSDSKPKRRFKIQIEDLHVN